MTRKFQKWLRYGERGFTLIELLIVIAVLGALASVVAPNVAQFMGVANLAAANSEVMNVKTASLAFLSDNGTSFPSDSTYLMSTGSGGAGVRDYLSGTARAKYYFNTGTGVVSQVDSVTGGWDDIVFDLSEQRWVRGSNDGSGGTQDKT